MNFWQRKTKHNNLCILLYLFRNFTDRTPLLNMTIRQFPIMPVGERAVVASPCCRSWVSLHCILQQPSVFQRCNLYLFCSPQSATFRLDKAVSRQRFQHSYRQTPRHTEPINGSKFHHSTSRLMLETINYD